MGDFLPDTVMEETWCRYLIYLMNGDGYGRGIFVGRLYPVPENQGVEVPDQKCPVPVPDGTRRQCSARNPGSAPGTNVRLRWRTVTGGCRCGPATDAQGRDAPMEPGTVNGAGQRRDLAAMDEKQEGEKKGKLPAPEQHQPESGTGCADDNQRIERRCRGGGDICPRGRDLDGGFCSGPRGCGPGCYPGCRRLRCGLRGNRIERCFHLSGLVRLNRYNLSPFLVAASSAG